MEISIKVFFKLNGAGYAGRWKVWDGLTRGKV